uniref:AMP-binding protein n=1 Tax=Mycolicibacterium smegmatis TaxID=1772 RepID=UPI001E5C0102
MTTNPTRRFLSIDLLGEDEHTRLDEFGHRAVLTQPVTAVSIPELFAAWVVRSPNAIAVSDGTHTMTYQQLDQASNQLAHLLTEYGAGPGQCVTLLMPR